MRASEPTRMRGLILNVTGIRATALACAASVCALFGLTAAAGATQTERPVPLEVESAKVETPLAVWLKPITSKGLNRAHTAYAIIDFGGVKVPDGSLPLPGLGAHSGPVPATKPKPGMGETRSAPGLRIPPTPKWHRLQRKDPSPVKESRSEDEVSFVPASLLPGFTAAADEPKPGTGAGNSRYRLGHIAPVPFDPERSELSTQASQSLEKLAKALKGDTDKIKLRAYTEDQKPVVSEYKMALQRAWAIRSFLVMRGIDKDRIVVHAVTPRPQDTATHRVDVLYTSG